MRRLLSALWQPLIEELLQGRPRLNDDQVKHLATVLHTFTLAVFAGLTVHSVLNDEWFRFVLVVPVALLLELLALWILGLLQE